MNLKNLLIGLTVLVVSLLNYKIARFLLEVIYYYIPDLSYPILISSLWLLVAATSVSLIGLNQSGLFFDYKKIIVNKKLLITYAILIILGLILFIFLGITKYFHSVKYPTIFFLITPIVEELIFRGYVYSTVSKFKNINPVLISSVLFGLHHLQYFNFSITTFSIFQVVYTFILGLLFGNIRRLSGSIYIGILLHILINFVTVYF